MTANDLWDIPAPEPFAPPRGPEPKVSPAPPSEPPAAGADAPPQALPPVADRPQLEPPAKPEPKQPSNPVAKWWADMRGDMAARKARGDGQWWAMRWMDEQPTSVHDYLHYYLHERDRRRDGRKGWGLTTEAFLIDEVHAVLYRGYGLTFGLLCTLIGYGGAWMGQRPGRALLLLAALTIAVINLVIWLAAG